MDRTKSWPRGDPLMMTYNQGECLKSFALDWFSFSLKSSAMDKLSFLIPWLGVERLVIRNNLFAKAKDSVFVLLLFASLYQVRDGHRMHPTSLSSD